MPYFFGVFDDRTLDDERNVKPSFGSGPFPREQKLLELFILLRNPMISAASGRASFFPGRPLLGTYKANHDRMSPKRGNKLLEHAG